MATEKLSQFPSGGTLNPATDQLVTVRTGNTDVLCTPGTAAAMAASLTSGTTVASISGAINAGHVATFFDTNGTIQDGGALGQAAFKAVSSNAETSVASVHGATTANHLAMFNDATGTIKDGGAFTVTESQISLSDVTTDNVTSTAHGFAPKSPADITKFLNGGPTPAYTTVTDTDLGVSDNTTNNVSTSAHGFAPKLPGNTTTFLRGDGTYAPPSGGASGNSCLQFVANAVTGQIGPSNNPAYIGTAGVFTSLQIGLNQVVMPGAGTIKGMDIALLAAPGGGNSFTFTINQNGSDTANTVTISNTSTTGSDHTHNVPIAQGDLVSIHVTQTGSPGNNNAAIGLLINFT